MGAPYQAVIDARLVAEKQFGPDSALAQALKLRQERREKEKKRDSMNAKVVYLAGPMRGYQDFNYPAFNEAAAKLRAVGFMVLNPVEVNHHSSGIRACMTVDTAMICQQAEGVVLLPGWEASSGARAEVALAECIGIPVKLVSEVL